VRVVLPTLGLFVVALFGALLPEYLPPFYVRVLQLFFFSAALALAWNILGGFAGYWSFGHTVFIGLGAFTAAHAAARLGGTSGSSWGMVLAVLAGAAVSALFAALVAYPILRLRGIYFAIAMLALSQVVSELVNNIAWFQGGVGVFLPSPLPSDMRPERFYYYVFGALLPAILAVSWIIRRSRLGYGLLAIREDEDTARMLGVPTEQFKIAAFVLSAALSGMLGAVYGYSLGYFTSASVFRIDFSLNMIVFCLIGGIGTLAGPIIGAALMLLLTQVLLSGFLEFHLFLTGMVVVMIVLLMPNGILGVLGPGPLRRRRSGPRAVTEVAT
jgi:branched-chain amino acid transport system permease protein